MIKENHYINGLQHRGTISTKPVFFEKITKFYNPLCGHMTFVLLTSARTVNVNHQFIQRITMKASNALNTLVSGKEESLQS